MQEWKNLKKEFLKDKKVAVEYKKLTPRYALISALIKVRIKKGLTQEELARKIGTQQSTIARVESGNANISFDFLEKMTQAMNSKLKIQIK